jgi:UDP-N-acetylglucosamine 2-epimerase (non-hydrolysing)
VEAGLRSFDWSMPEEVNRRVTDQLSDLLFATSPEAVGHLANEGIPVSSVQLTGNPMIDTLTACLDRLDTAGARARHGLAGRYVIATLHRPSNVDRPEVVRDLVRGLHEIAAEVDVLIPVHPRGRAAFDDAGLAAHPGVHICGPLGYLEFVALVQGAAAVLTDSGGVQEETTFLRVPCLTLRPNTERPITISSGSNRLITRAELAAAVLKACATGPYQGELPPLWDGAAGPRIARGICGWLADRGC